MPEEATTPTTETDTGPNVAQGNEADNEQSLTPGIKSRLERFERKILKEKVEPLQSKLDRIKNTVVEQGLDLAAFGFEAPQQQAEQPAVQTGPSQEAIQLKRLEAAYKADLPREALPLITATTEEDIIAQVNAVKLLNPRGTKIRSPLVARGANGNPLPIYKRSQLRDGKFYAEHAADILKAQVEGRIENDL